MTLADLNGPAAQAAGALAGEGLAARGVACDVTSEAEIAAVLEEVALEDGRLDVLVNNAGPARLADRGVPDGDAWSSCCG